MDSKLGSSYVSTSRGGRREGVEGERGREEGIRVEREERIIEGRGLCPPPSQLDNDETDHSYASQPVIMNGTDHSYASQSVIMIGTDHSYSSQPICMQDQITPQSSPEYNYTQ